MANGTKPMMVVDDMDRLRISGSLIGPPPKNPGTHTWEAGVEREVGGGLGGLADELDQLEAK